MNEKEWLDAQAKEARVFIKNAIDDYEDGRITLEQLNNRVAICVNSTLTKTYDHAFYKGIEDAELDGDELTEIDMNGGVEYDIEYDADDSEERDDDEL